MRGHFIVIALLMSYLLASYRYRSYLAIREGFKADELAEDEKEEKIDKKEKNKKEKDKKDNKEKEKEVVFDVDKLRYGYMNTFNMALSKEPLEVLKEPLPLQGIPDMPLNSSKKTKDECMDLFKMTNLEVDNKKEVKRNRKNFKSYDEDPLKPFLDYFEKNKLKVDRDRLNKVINDCAILSLRLKKIYNRPRPYQLCYFYGQPIQYLKSKHADTPSYPSSYALQSYVIAYLLGSKYSKHQKNLEEIADQISWSRVHSGNNFESDIECSKAILINLRNHLDTIEV
jgi:hypothetical protein